MKKKLLVRILLIVAALIVIAVIAVTLSLGSIVKKGVETVGSQLTKTPVSLDSASLSLLSGSGTINGLLVGNPPEFKSPSAIKVGRASMGVKPMSVFSDRIHVTFIRVENPEITFEGGLQGNNLSRILDNIQTAPETTTPPGKDAPQETGASKKIQVDDFLITGAQLHLSVTALAGKATTVPLPDIHLTGIGTGDGINVAGMIAKVMSALNMATLEAVQKSVAGITKDATEAVKELNKTAKGTTDSLKEASKGIGDIFKKK